MQEAAAPKDKNGSASKGKSNTAVGGASTPPAAATVSATDKANEFKDNGNALFKKGEYLASIQMYTAAIALAPRNPVYYSNRAMSYLKLEMYEQTISDCDSSIAVTWSAKAALRRGTARAAMGLWTEALDDFDAVVRSEPHNRAAVEQAEECRTMLATSVYADDVKMPVQVEGLL